MSLRTVNMTDALYSYYQAVGFREPTILQRLREETAAMPEAGMQISAEQGQFMGLLVELMGMKRIVEIGTFTGYSSLRMALSLDDDGHITACDVNDEWTQMARRYWEEAGVADRITLRLGPALESLDAMLADGAAETMDFVFIDADKENASHYYERALQLLRPGGLVGIDNTLWGGAVADPNNQKSSTEALRAINQHIHTDERVTMCLVPIGDGLTLARKR
ncbi:MAG: SAM-dependent methyltransferase [Deltaproteobacteria bacterium]|nr:MAG: SAM-dependent methyltransferase [Deltaproteobacteria bacterium]